MLGSSIVLSTKHMTRYFLKSSEQMKLGKILPYNWYSGSIFLPYNKSIILFDQTMYSI